MNTEINITPQDLFKADQVLTLEKAKQLIGKKLAITNPEYKHNSPSVRVFTLTAIETEWDLAAKEDMSHTDDGKYPTRQDYWATFGEFLIKQWKRTLKLVGEDGKAQGIWATCDPEMGGYVEPTFYGSDGDREIYYIVLDELISFFQECAKIPYPFMAQRVYKIDNLREDRDLILKILKETKAENPFKSIETYPDENLDKLCSLLYNWQCDQTELRNNEPTS